MSSRESCRYCGQTPAQGHRLWCPVMNPSDSPPGPGWLAAADQHDSCGHDGSLSGGAGRVGLTVPT